MPNKQFLFPVACLLLSAAAMSCVTSQEDPNVEFGMGQPIGRWQSAAAGTTSAPVSSQTAGRTSFAGAGSGTEVSVGSGTVGSGTTTGSGGSPAAGSGVAGSMAKAGTGGSATTGQAGRGGAGGVPAAGSGGSSSGGATLASLSFDVTTSPVGNRYQPKNIGAIWVQDANGKLVKSLEVWAGIRRRYLTRYASALSGGSVDVTASATLTSHKAHHATWNLKDRTGAPAPAGKYTLVMELTDGDTSGRSSTVEFDTSSGAMSMTPTDAPSFTAMKLQLQ